MKIMIRYLGYVLIISAFFRIIPLIAAIIYREPYLNFIITFLISFFLGFALVLGCKRIQNAGQETLTLTKGLMLVALSFIIIPLISAISFMSSFGNNFLNAFFESISGFTTTGLTLYSSVELLPKSLLLWRAETQWMGGIGIIMVFLFLLSRLRAHSYTTITEKQAETKSSLTLYQAQGFPEKLDPSFKKTTRNAIIIYSTYTILGIVLLFLVGLPLFDSISLSFTSLSTGGFTVNDGFYSNTGALVVLSIMMLLGSISFLTHNKIFQRKIKEFFTTFEKNVFFIFLIIGIAITLVVYPNFKVVIFELISAFTTTGYSMTEISLLPHLFIMIIMLGMIIGGSTASTAGGIKVFRIFALLKAIPWLLKKLSSPPGSIIPFKIKNKPFENEDVLILNVYVFCYFLILIIGTIIIALLGYNFLDSSFQMTSALGTVGMQTMQLTALHWIGKIVLILGMLLGRLEIFPLLILVRYVFKKH